MNQPRPGTAFQPGDVINNTYRIEALLGRGGTSDVYKARNEVSGRLMAIKVLKSEFSDNDDYLTLLKREEEIREVRHDAVVRYSENHRMEDGRVYLLMDFVDGTGLDAKMREGPMSADDLLVVCQRVVQGLEAAHSRHIVHRDLSPDNIILRAGDPAQAVIIDFGIAKDSNPGAETIVGNEFAGKYAYAAPEQLRGHTDARTDLYSLGALLLASFKGEPPDLGKNPMEVLESKALPLDTTDVPEPLKTVIDKLSAPEPEDRFPSAGAVLAYILGDDETDEDMPVATMIPAAAPSAAIVTPETQDKSPEADTPLLARLRQRLNLPETFPTRTQSLAGLAVLALLVGGGVAVATGALDRLFGPAHPPAEPFTLLVSQPEDGPPFADGYVPSEDMLTAMIALVGGAGGRTDLSLASGDIGKSWDEDVLEALTLLEPLNAWRLDATGNQVTITGETYDAEIERAVEVAFADGPPGVLEGDVDITLINIFLAGEDVEAILNELADCGPLSQPNLPFSGYGPGDSVTVTGRVASTATRVQLFDRIRELTADRQVILDLEVLNPTLCLLESHLPPAPTGGVSFSYFLGDSMLPNPSDTFLVGENPVIDVVLPPSVTEGYLNVSVLDVSGNVFHLLPNVLVEDNSVASLRGGATGTVSVRVAYPDNAARSEDQLAFRVDDSTLGKSKVVAILSSAPLFDGLRPMVESAEGFAEALRAHAEANDALILTLDSRILTTKKP